MMYPLPVHVRSLCAALLLTCLVAGKGQAQTNDPLVLQQRYLFDVHKLVDAWQITTGSSNNRIAIYSMLGFLQNHEDLPSARLLPAQGSLLMPDLDFGTEAAGIAGAATNNGVGMAGIDRAALLRSYSALRVPQYGDDPSGIISFQRSDGTTFNAFLDLHQFSSLVNQARTDGANVHLFTFGVPSGRASDYILGDPKINSSPPTWTNWAKGALEPPQHPQRKWFFQQLGTTVSNILNALCYGSGCVSPPDPLRSFRAAVSNAVILGDGVVVAPAGDLELTGQVTPSYMPGMIEKYVVAVGGLQYAQNQIDVEPWSLTKAASYVDVAAFAQNVVGTSGRGSDQYNTSFGGTSAAASIGAGVASLLKAVRPDFTGEDIEEVLKRTARDVGVPDRDDETGYGAIDAEAALRFATETPITQVVAQFSVPSNSILVQQAVALRGYEQFWPDPHHVVTVRGDLYTFTQRINYPQGYSNKPHVWLRWAASTGVETARQVVQTPNGLKPESRYDPFERSLEIIASDHTGFTVRGYFWYAAFYNGIGQLLGYNRIPGEASPNRTFTVAYTVAGTPGTPPTPFTVTLDGADFTDPRFEPAPTFTATPAGGTGPFSYTWRYRLPGNPSWHTAPSSSNTYTHYPYFGGVHTLEVTATNSASETATALKYLQVYECQPGDPGGPPVLECPTRIGGPEVAALVALPEHYALHAPAPNPLSERSVIAYALPEAAHVRLTVHDLLGREVARLVDGEVGAGHHRVTFEASSLPSGVYLYRMEATGSAGALRQTGRLTVVR